MHVVKLGVVSESLDHSCTLDRTECVAEVDFDADVCRIELHVNADDEPMGLGPSRGALAELHRLTFNAHSLALIELAWGNANNHTEEAVIMELKD